LVFGAKNVFPLLTFNIKSWYYIFIFDIWRWNGKEALLYQERSGGIITNFNSKFESQIKRLKNEKIFQRHTIKCGRRVLISVRLIDDLDNINIENNF
jgi:hypothetical protein